MIFFDTILKLRFDNLNKTIATKKRSPPTNFILPVADVFPNYPIHTLDNMYKADLKKDVEEDEHCNEHSNPHQQ